MVRNLCLVLLLGASFIPLRSDDFLLEDCFLLKEVKKKNLKSSEKKESLIEQKKELPEEYALIKRSEPEALKTPLKKSESQSKYYIYEAVRWSLALISLVGYVACYWPHAG